MLAQHCNAVCSYIDYSTWPWHCWAGLGRVQVEYLVLPTCAVSTWLWHYLASRRRASVGCLPRVGRVWRSVERRCLLAPDQSPDRLGRTSRTCWCDYGIASMPTTDSCSRTQRCTWWDLYILTDTVVQRQQNDQPERCLIAVSQIQRTNKFRYCNI